MPRRFVDAQLIDSLWVRLESLSNHKDYIQTLRRYQIASVMAVTSPN